jgi:hypothetical protein
MERSASDPAHKSLDALVGEWSVEISNISSMPDSPVVRGRVRFEWLEGAAFVIMHSDIEHGDFPHSVAVIGSDDSAETYSMLYFDSRGVSRIYGVSLEGGVWKIWRDSQNFSQRFTGTFSDDGNTITARWEKSRDGSGWEHDMDLTYRRNER